MILSRYTVNNIGNERVQVPEAAVFALPEKVLQFGTGDRLRSLPGYFIDKANQQGLFNGRIVAVEASIVDVSAFNKQDCLYTLCMQGEQTIEEFGKINVNAAISRVLHAGSEWQQVLECAHNPEMKIILWDTTETSYELTNDDVRLHPPQTFPGRLLSFLYERFRAFSGSSQSGMVIVSMEEIPADAKKLEAIVFELAHLNGLEDNFIEWLETSNQFCSSIADRGIIGKPGATRQVLIEEELGYADHLMLIAEPACSWRIDGDEQAKAVLSFAKADEAIVIKSLVEQNELLVNTKPVPSSVVSLAPAAEAIG